ncbi:MAG: radical SAM protein [Candidatus Omnitrophica bacterium]|nr:radical SAM protein [Candidatus Omnitrophota bacterium]
MHDLKLSKYMYETFAIGSNNQLPISSVCNGQCIFCSNNMNPFTIYREGFRPLADIKKGLALLNVGPNEEIRIGDSLPGRISEGEALLHPDILKVLRLIRERFPGNVIQMNTNGTILEKSFIEKLIPFKPLKFTISYHSDNPKFWCKIFKLKENKYKIVREAFFNLSKNGFIIQAALVPLPHLVGYDDIENTIKAINFYTKDVIVYAPGYSFKATKELKAFLKSDYAELSRFIIKMRKKYGMNLELFPDLLKPIEFFPYRVMQNTFFAKFKNVLWLFSEAAFEKGKKALQEWNDFVPNEHHAFLAKNDTYRGNIICSGLLMVKDYRKAIKKALSEFKKQGIKIDLIVLPSNSFDRYGDDLQGENHSKLNEEFKLPVWLR